MVFPVAGHGEPGSQDLQRPASWATCLCLREALVLMEAGEKPPENPALAPAWLSLGPTLRP